MRNPILSFRISDGFSVGVNVDAVSGLGVDATFSYLFVRTGNDQGKVAVIGDAGTTIGLNVGVSLSFTEYYYFDPSGKNELHIDDFTGPRYALAGDYSISGTVEVGLGLTIAPIESDNNINMIGVAYQYGVSPPTEMPVSFDVNKGATWFIKKY